MPGEGTRRPPASRPTGHGAAPGRTTFRPACPADRDSILAVAAKLSNNWIPYTIDEALVAARGGFFVAETDGRVVAICRAYLEGDGAWLEAMRVDPEFQGRGLATELTRQVLDACVGWGCRYARLSTDVSNAPVHHFLGARLGFRALGRWVYLDDVTDFDPLAEPRPAPGTVPSPSTATSRTVSPAATPTSETVPPPSTAASGEVRVAAAPDLGPVWDFLAAGSRAGRIRPAGLLSNPHHPWRLTGLTREGVSGLLGEGLILVHEKPASGASRTRGSGPLIDGVAFTAVHAQGPTDPAGDGWASISFLEGPPEVMASLLKAAVDQARQPGIGSLAVGLPGSQWEVFETLVRPEWLGSGPSLDGVIYEKELGLGGGGST